MIPARRPSPIDAYLICRACARLWGLFILRVVPVTVLEQADWQQIVLSLVPGGAHSKSACVAKAPRSCLECDEKVLPWSAGGAMICLLLLGERAAGRCEMLRWCL